MLEHCEGNRIDLQLEESFCSFVLLFSFILFSSFNIGIFNKLCAAANLFQFAEHEPKICQVSYKQNCTNFIIHTEAN